MNNTLLYLIPHSKNAYWKVHKNNIISMNIIGLPSDFINAWKDGSACTDNYMYVSYETKRKNGNWGFMFYKPESIEWFKRHKYEYLGEFNMRKIKLKKINENSLSV